MACQSDLCAALLPLGPVGLSLDSSRDDGLAGSDSHMDAVVAAFGRAPLSWTAEWHRHVETLGFPRPVLKAFLLSVQGHPCPVKGFIRPFLPP